MKRFSKIVSSVLSASMMVSMMFSMALAEPTDIKIDTNAFPDSKLCVFIKNYEATKAAFNHDGYLSSDEIKKFNSLNLSGSNDIASLEGLGTLRYLETLNISNLTNIKEIDLNLTPFVKEFIAANSGLESVSLDSCYRLEKINLYGTNISSIDLSKCSKLTSLSLGATKIEEVDISANTKLTDLNLICNDNRIKRLNVGKNDYLVDAFKYGTKSTGTISGSNFVSYSYMPSDTLYMINVDEKTEIYDGTVQVNAQNFPDSVFRSYISKEVDVNNDKILSIDEIDNCQIIDIHETEMNSLQGIDFFTNLATLKVCDNKLTSLDVSHNKELDVLECSGNKLTSLDVSNNTKIFRLIIDENDISKIDITNLNYLIEFDCSNTKITSLDLSKNVILLSLDCSDNEITSLDLSANTELFKLDCGYCKLTTLDFKNNPSLEYLTCTSNELTSIVFGGVDPRYIVCNDNNLTALDLNSFADLEEVDCRNNKIKNLDLRDNSKLGVLKCCGNQINSIDISGNPILAKLLTDKKKANGGITAYYNEILDCGFSFGLPDNSIIDYYYLLAVDDTTSIKSGDKTLVAATTPVPTTSVPTATPTAKPTTVAKPTAVPNSGNPSGNITTAPASKPTTVPNSGNQSGNITTAPASKPTTVPNSGNQSGNTTTAPASKPTTVPNSGNQSGNTTTAPIAKPTTDPKSEDGIPGFAERLYTTCLGRASEPEGKAYWIEQLKIGKTGADVAYGFFFSKELTDKKLSDEEFVTRLYRTFMNREPDKSGMDYWLNELKIGKNRDFVFNGFVNSPEWADVCLKYGILSGGAGVPTFEKDASEEVVAFATRLYTTCLGREPEKEGLEYWSKELANLRKLGKEAAAGFFFSPEFENAKYNNEEFITRLYRTFMGREPELDGFNFWLGQLNAGKSRMEIFNGFAASPEFIGICSDAGIIA